MNILVSYRGAPRIRGWETGAMLARAFRSLGHEVDEYAKIYERPEWVANRNDMLSKHYDLHVYCECNDGDAQYLELKDINADRRVAWLFDIAMMADYYRRLVKMMEFDHCFAANLDFAYNNFFHCPTTYLPYAADMEFFGRPLDTKKTIDVCLVGSDRPERRDLIAALHKHEINAELISGVFKEDYINTLAASKIVINDLAGGGTNLLSMRTFEAPAAGAMLLQAYTPALNNVMEVGICCDVFTNNASLISACKYFMEKDQQRKTIANNGQFWVSRTHTYNDRAKAILK